MKNESMMKHRIFAGLAALTVIGAASMAMAQVSSHGGPVQVGADLMHTDQNVHTTYLDGRVEILQDNARLRADHAKIIYAEAGGDIISMEATGNVYYITEDNTMKGDTAVYTKADDTMVLTGGPVILQQGKNVMTGNRLVSQVGKGITTMDANTTETGKGRVRAVFYPGKNGQAQAQGAVAPAAKPAGQ